MAKRTVHLGQGMVRPGCYAEGGTVAIDDDPPLALPAPRPLTAADMYCAALSTHTHSVGLPALWSTEAMDAARHRALLHQQIMAGQIGVGYADMNFQTYLRQAQSGFASQLAAYSSEAHTRTKPEVTDERAT